MKKKVFFAIALIIIIVSGISIVYADLIIPGEKFNLYEDNEKFDMFLQTIDSPLKKTIVMLTMLTFLLGIVILVFNYVKGKNDNENNKSKNILNKIYIGISFILNILQIQILKSVLFFNAEYTGVRTMNAEDKVSPIIIPTLYIGYAIIMIVSFIIAKKMKKEKIVIIVTTIITLLLFIICAIIVFNTPAGYYTYDKSRTLL